MAFLRNVTFMTSKPEALADFWAAALGLPERQEHTNEVLIASSDWAYPRLTFQRIDDASGGRANRVHLDITPADGRRAEVERLCLLGGREIRTEEDDGFAWTVMADPDGNEFCVTDA